MKETASDPSVHRSTGPDPRAVRGMFAGIAHRYDFLNHFLSGSVDIYWRRVAARTALQMSRTLASPACLDLCSGTGDLALTLNRYLHVPVVASDFCHPMLVRSNQKVAGKGRQSDIRTVEADALSLPFSPMSFDVVTIAFGLRNLEDVRRGLEEMRRVLTAGGSLVILEFSKPVTPVFRHLFQAYFRYVLPRLGAAISGNDHAYQYLPDSVRNFPDQRRLVSLMESVGFSEVGYRNLTGGVAALHWGRRGK